MEIGTGYDLDCLSINQLERVIEVQGDIDALCHAREHIQFMHPAFHVGNHLGAFQRDSRLAAQGFQEGDITGLIVFARDTLTHGNPTDQAFLSGDGDKKLGSKQQNAPAFWQNGIWQVIRIHKNRQQLVTQDGWQGTVEHKAKFAGNHPGLIRGGYILVTLRIENIDVELVGKQADVNLCAQNAKNIIESQSIAQFTSKDFQAFLLSTLSPKKVPVDAGLHPTVNRIENIDH